MIDRAVNGASIAALLMFGLWRPSPSHALALDLLVCAGGALVVVTLFFRTQIQMHLAEARASRGNRSGGWTS